MNSFHQGAVVPGAFEPLYSSEMNSCITIIKWMENDIVPGEEYKSRQIKLWGVKIDFSVM